MKKLLLFTAGLFFGLTLQAVDHTAWHFAEGDLLLMPILADTGKPKEKKTIVQKSKHNGKEKEVKIEVEVENGKKTTSVYVNGKKVAPDSEEYKAVMKDADIQIVDGEDFENDEVIVIKDEKRKVKKIRKKKGKGETAEKHIRIIKKKKGEHDEDIIIKNGGDHHEESFDKIKTALIKDGLLKDKKSNLDFDLSKKGLKVNGKKQSADLFEKYKKLYEEIMGKKWSDDSKYKIKLKTDKKTRL